MMMSCIDLEIRFGSDYVKLEKLGTKPINDFQTPGNVCDYMASMIPKEAKTILEPTPGIGNLVTAVQKLGYEVTAPSDFFLLDFTQKFDCIVMNPPFSSKSAIMKNAPKDVDLKGMKLGYYMLNQCMEMSENIIALMPWFTISDSDVRVRKLRDFGLKSLTLLHRKTFKYARIQTVIINLQKDWNEQTTLHYFE